MTEYRYTKFTSIRLIDGKQKKVIVDFCGDVINRNPTKDELRGIEKYLSVRDILKLPEEKKKKYLLEFLNHFYEKEGISPKVQDFADNPKYPSDSTYQRVFGSWNSAIEMAGLPKNWGGNKGRVYTNEELLEFLRQFYIENGRSPEQLDFNKNPGYPNYGVYRVVFGSWNSAIELAGLQPFNFTNKTDEELLDYLIQFYEENGRSPRIIDFINNPKYPSFGVYIRCFGSWNNGLKLVGLDVDSMVMNGIIDTKRQKGRLAEILVIKHFNDKDKVRDLSGENCNSPIDGICPNGKSFEVKSSMIRVSLAGNHYYDFVTRNNKENLDWFYLLGFNEDYSELRYAWRVSGDFNEEDSIKIGFCNSWGYNLENMKEYEITKKIKYIFYNWIDNIQNRRNGEDDI